jgi:Bacterial SH3 domain
MFRLVTVIGLIGIASSAKAGPVRMTGDDIKRVMQPGAVLAIDTPLHISIPVTVAHGGIVSAEAGALGLTLGALKDRGRWWTDGDQLCMKWFRWFDARQRCMVLHRDGNKVQWAEGSGESGTATITEAAPVVAAATLRTAKKEKPFVTATLVEPVNATVENANPPPATETATPAPAETPVTSEPPIVSASPATPETPTASETPSTSDRLPALQFAAAALAEAMPKPAPITPSKLGMGETAPVEAAPPPVDEQPAAETTPPPRAENDPKPKAKPAAVAVRSPSARKSAPAAGTSKPVQVSFRVSGVIDGDTLNVRSGPSENHPAVGRIPASGRGVHIVGTCRDTWCPIKHGRLKGWVNRYYLAEDVSLRR